MNDRMSMNEFIAFVSTQTEKIFRQTGRVLPMYHAIKRDGHHIVGPMPDANKDTAVAIVRALFELQDVVRYVFIDEAWTVCAKSEEADALRNMTENQGLASHPDRIEILMFHAEDENEGVTMGMRDIIRGKGKTKLGPLKLERPNNMEGRMAGMLPRRTRAH